MFGILIIIDETPGPGRVVLTYSNEKLVQMDGVTPDEWVLGESIRYRESSGSPGTPLLEEGDK